MRVDRRKRDRQKRWLHEIWQASIDKLLLYSTERKNNLQRFTVWFQALPLQPNSFFYLSLWVQSFWCLVATDSGAKWIWVWILPWSHTGYETQGKSPNISKSHLKKKYVKWSRHWHPKAVAMRIKRDNMRKHVVQSLAQKRWISSLSSFDPRLLNHL